MRLALLGIDLHLALLAEAVARDGRHEVAVVSDAGELASQVLGLHPGAIREGDWETLLLGGNFELLVVGTACENTELRIEQLRRFVQEGVPLVVVQPAAEAIVLHELAMIQRDTGSLLAAWNPVLAHPAVVRIQEQFPPSDNAPGGVSHVAFARALDEPKWPAIGAQIARDAQWLRDLIGPPNRVTALAPESEDDSLRALAVTFVGPSDALAQWTLGAGGHESVVTIAWPAGQAVWKIAPDGSSHLTIDAPSGKPTGHLDESWSSAESRDAVGKSFVTFLEAMHQAKHDEANFDHATRAVELAEAARESNRRSRTIHLHYEEHSEQQTFKSVMAAGGCLILLLVLFVLGASTVIDSIGEPVRNNPWWRIWSVYLLIPVVLFLLLQTLWRVFASPKTSGTN